MRATPIDGHEDVCLEELPDVTVRPPTDTRVRRVAAWASGSGSGRRFGPAPALDQAGEAWAATDRRRAVGVMLRP